jgi:hypothetical protein
MFSKYIQLAMQVFSLATWLHWNTVCSESCSALKLQYVDWLLVSNIPSNSAVVSLYSVVKQRLKSNTGKVCNYLIKFYWLWFFQLTSNTFYKCTVIFWMHCKIYFTENFQVCYNFEMWCQVVNLRRTVTAKLQLPLCTLWKHRGVTDVDRQTAMNVSHAHCTHAQTFTLHIKKTNQCG